MTTTTDVIRDCLRVFATWRSDVRAAGFRPGGYPLSAYNACSAALSNLPNRYMEDGEGFALARAEAALAAWCANGTDFMREGHQPLLDRVRAALAPPVPTVELTPIGEQYVVPGCERDTTRGPAQLGLWDAPQTPPALVCTETLPDGSQPVRLSFAIRVF